MSRLERASFAEMECPIARAIEEVGDGWSLLIIREALKGLRHFGQFQERLGIAPNTLTRRLDKLCEHALLRRRRYQHKPPRDEYGLTEKGLALLPVLLALGEWGNHWVVRGQPSIVPVDARTGAPIELAIIDRRTGKPIEPGSVGVVAGPGASAALRAVLARPLTLGADDSATPQREPPTQSRRDLAARSRLPARARR